ncbi:MAG: DMT family transporter [Trueperaceae bacterium]
MARPDPPPARLAAGVATMVAAMAILPVQDGIAKHLMQDLPLGQVVWARYTFHFALLLPVLLIRFGPRRWIPEQVGAQLLRGVLLLTGTVLFFASLRFLPIADTLALFFVSPLVVTTLAPRLLGEPIGWRRMLAVAVGFAGVLIIVRPGSGVFGAAALLGLGAGTVNAFYFIVTRRLAGSAPPLLTLGYTALVGTILTSLAVAFWWEPLSWVQLSWMVLLGLCGATAHLLIIEAFDRAPAAWLAPVGYSEIVMATVVGYLWFGDLPDVYSWVGIAVIVASGSYISWRERRMYGRPAVTARDDRAT